MDYEYDVFLSYRRFQLWPTWVNEKFLPLFCHWLGEELGKNVRVFFDTSTVETGKEWPLVLGKGLAQSCVLVALWSRTYFSSPWCRAELAHICAREKQCGFNTAHNVQRLILPAIIHDGQAIPHFIKGITAADLQDCANVRTARESVTEERLSSLIRAWAPDVSKAIQAAPTFEESWVDLAVEEFIALFNAMPAPKQRVAPSLAAVLT
jgi:hypothetical protein